MLNFPRSFFLSARRYAAVTLLLSLLVFACKKEEPSRWDNANAANNNVNAPAAQTSAAAPAEAKPEAGGSFNRFFPKAADGYTVVFVQEKPGFAEAKLQQNGADVGVLSVTDTAANPEARAKFATSTELVEGHPLVTVGNNQSSLLVKDRFQVKVSSQTLDPMARKLWLARYDLAGLSSL